MFRKFLPLVFALLASIVWTLSLIASQNILFYNRDWRPYSLSFGRTMISGHELLLGRQFIAYGSLNADMFGKKLRLMTRKKWNPEKIRFSTKLRKNGFISVMSTEDGNSFTALRLSANKILVPQFYQFDVHEKFTFTRKFPIHLPVDENISIEIENGPEKITVYSESKKIAEVEGHLPSGFIGLETTESTHISSPEIVENKIETGLPFQRDTFFPKFIAIFCIFILIALFLPVQVIVAIAISGSLWLSYDYFSYSRQMFAWNHHLFRNEPSFKNKINIEPARQAIFDSWYSLMGGNVVSKKEVESEYGPPYRLNCFRWSHDGKFEDLDIKAARFPTARKKRLLLVGGSMDLGIGTTTTAESYDVKLHHLIDAEILNVSRGLPFLDESNNKELLRAVDEFRPDAVLFDLEFPRKSGHFS